MRPGSILRFALITALGSGAAACASYDPVGGHTSAAPQSPELWSGAYGGDAPSDDRYAEKGRYDNDSRDHVEMAEVAPAAPVDSHRGGYGTNGVQASALPPPTDSGAPSGAQPLPPPADSAPPRHRDHDLPPPVDTQASNNLPLPSDDSDGRRTLTTNHSADAAPPQPAAPSKSASTAPAAPPAGPSVTHKVKGGESLSDVAAEYGVREVDIIALNELRPPYNLRNGQTIKIPAKGQASARPQKGDTVVAGDRIPTPLPKPNLPGSKVASAAPLTPVSTKPSAKDGEGTSGSGRFEWPVTGKVIASYGAAGDGLYNEGINIAVPTGTPVHAAAEGTVRYAGNELAGYGNLVLIEHPDGYVTAYAHNSALIVKRGDHVSRGMVIARSGQTGNVKSPQVHFEIRKGKQSIDPQKYLVATN